MRYLSFFHPDPATAGQPPTAQHMEDMNKLVEEMTAAGVLLSTGAYLDGAVTARVRSSAGKVTVTDAPAPKADGRMIGYAILNAKSKEHVIELTKRFLAVAGGGECELHALLDAPPKE